jgi:hypothetical protein
MRVVVFALIALAGCSSATLIDPPDGGYAGIKATRPMRVPHAFSSVWEVPVGTVLVADRRNSQGLPLYCGQVSLGDAVIRQSEFVCATYRNGVLGMRANQAFSSPPFAVPPGAIEEIRIP